MKTYGKTTTRYTPGIIPYASSSLAQAAITAQLSANSASYTPAQITDAFSAATPTAPQQIIISASNAALAAGTPLVNIGGGTIYENTYSYVSNGNSYFIEYTIRFDGVKYWVDSALVNGGGISTSVPGIDIYGSSGVAQAIITAQLAVDLAAFPGSTIVGNSIAYPHGGGKAYSIRMI